MRVKTIPFQFRFPVKQTGPMTIELVINRGDGPPVIDKDFSRLMGLSDEEYEKAEELVIRSVAIVPLGAPGPEK